VFFIFCFLARLRFLRRGEPVALGGGL